MAHSFRAEEAQSLPHKSGGARASDQNQAADGPLPKRATTPHGLIEAYLAAPHRITRLAARQLLTTDLSQASIDKLSESWRAYSPHTRSNLLYAITRILRPLNLGLRVPRTRRPQPRKIIATDDDLRRILKLADPVMRLFVNLTGGLALRFAEAFRLAPEHVLTDHISIEVKGGYTKHFPLAPALAAELREIERLPEQGSYLQRLAGRRITAGAIRKRWRKLVKRAGCPHLHPHDLRRTAAVYLYKQTGDVIAVKALLGHEQLSTTAWYLYPHEAAQTQELKERLRVWNEEGKVIQ